MNNNHGMCSNEEIVCVEAADILGPEVDLKKNSKSLDWCSCYFQYAMMQRHLEVQGGVPSGCRAGGVPQAKIKLTQIIDGRNHLQSEDHYADFDPLVYWAEVASKKASSSDSSMQVERPVCRTNNLVWICC